MQEKVIETKQCKHCNTKFEITDKDLEFYEKVSPVFGGKKYNIPTPTLCPDCRQQRRLSFRNERHLYKRNCDATGKQIISIYSPDKPYKVYNSEFWWSDEWDAMDYGKEFDFSRGFFEQFDELFKNVPRIAILNQNSENSEYTNYSGNNKNCYFIFGGTNSFSENSMYGNLIEKCYLCLDGINLVGCDNCYETLDSKDSSKLFYCHNCINCSNSLFLINSTNCTDCVGCVNLINKKFCIFNRQYTENDYKKIVADFYLNTIEGLNKFKKEFSKFKMTQFFLETNKVNCDYCIGNNLINCKNTQYIFDGNNCENVKYGSYNVYSVKDCQDNDYAGAIELGFNNHSWTNSFYGIGCNVCWGTDNLFYCDFCFNTSKNCFGCTGLRNKQYCILNKQYTKEEYEKLVPKIIEHMMKTGEWGEFFPSSISPFGYNETVAMEYFPLSKEEVQKKGFKWSDYEQPLPNVEKIIQANKLPENISDIPDDILNWAIECEVTKKPFRIIKLELEFYRKHNLPIPKRHPDQRHLDRMALRNPRKLFDRKCYKCGVCMKTTYSPDRKELVYCEKCYEKEVY